MLGPIAGAHRRSGGTATEVGELLLEGDMQSGTDALSLEGDMQSGVDTVENSETT